MTSPVPAPLSAPTAAPSRVCPAIETMQRDSVFRQAATMTGKRILVLAASHPFLFFPESAAPGAVKIFTDAAAFRAFCGSAEAAGFVLRVHFYDGQKVRVVFYDPTNAGRHVRAVVDAGRYFNGVRLFLADEPGVPAVALCQLHELAGAINYGLETAARDTADGYPGTATASLESAGRAAVEFAALARSLGARYSELCRQGTEAGK